MEKSDIHQILIYKCKTVIIVSVKGEVDSNKRIYNLYKRELLSKNSWRSDDGPDVNLVNNFCLMKGFKNLRCSWRIGNT